MRYAQDTSSSSLHEGVSSKLSKLKSRGRSSSSVDRTRNRSSFKERRVGFTKAVRKKSEMFAVVRKRVVCWPERLTRVSLFLILDSSFEQNLHLQPEHSLIVVQDEAASANGKAKTEKVKLAILDRVEKWSTSGLTIHLQDLRQLEVTATYALDCCLTLDALCV
jgi:hypothetical protein